MKFIKGPYVAYPDFGSILGQGEGVACVYWNYDEEAYHNTVHLMAASLEMYEALKTAEQVLQRFSDERYAQPCINEIQNALAKAEGRTHASTD